MDPDLRRGDTLYVCARFGGSAHIAFHHIIPYVVFKAA
jgi:hypothetical protein